MFVEHCYQHLLIQLKLLNLTSIIQCENAFYFFLSFHKFILKLNHNFKSWKMRMFQQVLRSFLYYFCSHNSNLILYNLMHIFHNYLLIQNMLHKSYHTLDILKIQLHPKENTLLYIQNKNLYLCNQHILSFCKHHKYLLHLGNNLFYKKHIFRRLC